MPSSYRVCHESMEGRISKRMFQENKARQIFQKFGQTHSNNSSAVAGKLFECI